MMSFMVIGSVQRYCMRTWRWSCRSAPTPGMSATTSMPRDCSRPAGPTPESCRSCGELNAPPAMMTSPAPRRPQVAHGRRPTASVARRQLIVAGALLGRTVEVVVARKARLLHRCQESLAQRMRLAHIGDRERSADAMPGIFAALLVLGAAEVGKHVGEAPAGVAELAPMIEILVLAADIEEAVDGARSAQHLAARLDDPAIIELGLRLRTVQPVDLGVGEQLSVAERDVNPDVAILAAGFEEKHAMAARRGQAMREHAAGAAGTDDDVVERFRRPPHAVPPLKLRDHLHRS